MSFRALFTLRASSIPLGEVGFVGRRSHVFGTIKKVVKDKGFGFIIADDGGDDVFFHRSRLGPKVYFEELREGTEVQFDCKPGEKGRQAFNVRLR